MKHNACVRPNAEQSMRSTCLYSTSAFGSMQRAHGGIESDIIFAGSRLEQAWGCRLLKKNASLGVEAHLSFQPRRAASFRTQKGAASVRAVKSKVLACTTLLSPNSSGKAAHASGPEVEPTLLQEQCHRGVMTRRTASSC